MLIKVFGIWLAMNNGYLYQAWDGCEIRFSSVTGYHELTFNQKCDQVAEEINKQTKGE